jgi:hypothetical protein
MKRFYHIRDLVTALSLSNLCFLAVWRSVLSPPHFNGYHLTEPPMWRDCAALMLDVLLLATLFWAPYAFARRQQKEHFLVIARWVFLFVVFAALDGIRRQLYGPLTAPALKAVVGKTAFIAILVIAFFLTVFVLARRSRQIISIARAIVLIFSPFVLVTFSQAAWSLVRSRPANAAAKNRSAADAGSNIRPATRVLWLIFDELDYRAAFVARPSSIELPELDRLRAESIVATNAYPPAGVTLQSIPALVTGRLVSSARIADCDKLMLTFDGTSEPVSWSKQPNIFSRTRAIGGSTAVVGWYHPYCRVLSDDLTRCSLTALGIESESDRHSHSVTQSMLAYFWRVSRILPIVREVLPKSSGPDERWESMYVEGLKRIGQESAAAAADANLSLTMIHFPAPHPPCLYDRRKDDFTFESGCNYFDNLELADRTFGELRRAMEEAGLWDDTVVLVSSDHWWRIGTWPQDHSWTEEEQAVISEGVDYRVPFMLKLKRERKGSIYHPSFNTILSQGLLLALLEGELSTPSDVKAWLDRHRSIGKSPY